MVGPAARGSGSLRTAPQLQQDGRLPGPPARFPLCSSLPYGAACSPGSTLTAAATAHARDKTLSWTPGQSARGGPSRTTVQVSACIKGTLLPNRSLFSCLCCPCTGHHLVTFLVTGWQEQAPGRLYTRGYLGLDLCKED